MWKFFRLNYYGGEVWHHTDGRRAVQIFNHYHKVIGFEIFDGTEYYMVKNLN